MVKGLRQETSRSDVDELRSRVDDLVRVLSTVASGLASREAEVLALGVRLDQEDTDVRALVGGLRESLEVLSSEVAAVRDQPRDDDLIDALERRLDATSTRLT